MSELDRIASRRGRQGPPLVIALHQPAGGKPLERSPGVAARVLGSVVGDDVPGGWQLPRAPRVVVDHDYVLAPAGLLVERHPAAAYALVMRLVGDAP